MIASMASGWRVDTKLDQPGERAWNAEVADENDSAQPRSCCLHVMEDHQNPLDILRSLQFDTVQGLWGFVKFSDTIDPATLRAELSNQGYGYTKTALTMLAHFAPMLLKLDKVYDGPTNSRGCGIVAGCGRSGSMARGFTVRTLGKLRIFCEKILHCKQLAAGRRERGQHGHLRRRSHHGPLGQTGYGRFCGNSRPQPHGL